MRSYIPTLDGWRAVAIGAVILSHAFPPQLWTGHGALGVNLFFAISGFLITTRLIEDDYPSLGMFYARRAFRILPPALFFLACLSVLTLSGVVENSWTDILSALLLVRNYWGGGAETGWYTGHFWSLAVEEHFYLFWPAILMLAGCRRARWVAPALAATFALWRSLDMRHGWTAALFHYEGLRGAAPRSDYRMDALLWGCTLALIWSRWPKWATGSLLSIGSLATAIALDIAKPAGYLAIQAVLFPFALACTVSEPRALLSRVLELAPLRWIGRLSYSLYLWQQLFFSQTHTNTWQQLPWNFAGALACAMVSYYAIERPALRFGRALLSRQGAVESRITNRQSKTISRGAAAVLFSIRSSNN